MNTYIVRPYFGHDCNSESGFNNGHYLEAITVDANDEQEAVDKAMAQFRANDCNMMVPASADVDGSFGDNTIYWEFDHVYVTDDATEYTDPDDIPLGDAETAIEPDSGNWAQDYETHYLYQYIDFNDVTEATTARAGAK